MIKISLRPCYADTDQMGFVHHSNYVRFYENARWEAFRKMGLPYKTIEEKGILMPVIDMSFKFIKPAYYDDQLTVNVGIKSVGNTRLKFSYETYRNQHELISTASTTLAFINKTSRRPCRIPDFVDKVLLIAN
jgi:acyl-CoA thioester hydrolase